MIQLLRLLCGALIGLLRSSARREAEILVLRHQINILRRKSPNRAGLSNFDRLLFVLLSQLVPSTLDALTVIKPATVIRWHRAGFRAYWRWKSRPRGGRPRMSHEIRQLIRDMSLANPLWGAPRIRGELLKLGIDVGKPRSPNTWQSIGGLHRRAAGRSCAITLTASRQWTCSWFRPSLFDCSMDC
jgi:hypothetical protein